MVYFANFKSVESHILDLLFENQILSELCFSTINSRMYRKIPYFVKIFVLSMF